MTSEFIEVVMCASCVCVMWEVARESRMGCMMKGICIMRMEIISFWFYFFFGLIILMFNVCFVLALFSNTYL